VKEVGWKGERREGKREVQGGIEEGERGRENRR
jgi:hypothetical protein